MKGKKPLQEIAAELGISPAAISFVLNNKKGVSDATRAEAAALLEHYGYTIKRELRKPMRENPSTGTEHPFPEI